MKTLLKYIKNHNWVIDIFVLFFISFISISYGNLIVFCISIAVYLIAVIITEFYFLSCEKMANIKNTRKYLRYDQYMEEHKNCDYSTLRKTYIIAMAEIERCKLSISIISVLVALIVLLIESLSDKNLLGNMRILFPLNIFVIFSCLIHYFLNKVAELKMLVDIVSDLMKRSENGL